MLRSVYAAVTAAMGIAVCMGVVRPCLAQEVDSGWAKVPEMDRPQFGKEEHQLIPGWTAVSQWDKRVKVFDLRGPRAFGLLTGDKVRQRVVVAVERPYRLQRSSLPPVHWVNSGLELQSVKARETRQDTVNRYVITVRYQLFITPRLVSLDVIPGFGLRFMGKRGAFALKVPNWVFSISPILKPEPLVRNVWDIPVRADAPPSLVNATLPAYGLTVFGAVSALLMIYWLYIYSIWPFGRRGQAPFALACRKLRTMRRRADDAVNLQDGFRAVHQAFNATAGEVVFVEHLERFFDAKPSFKTRRESVEQFFDQSRQLFFAGGARPQAARMDLAELESLCRQYRAAEREAR